ncbi:MAG: glycosyltransferase family 39 protein [Chloroflexi bacterium]|nr:glycosyltransferase family 39 protein [Chloroflexota bacterium]
MRSTGSPRPQPAPALDAPFSPPAGFSVSPILRSSYGAPTILLTLCLVGGAALLAAALWRSLSWPLIHDSPLMHYIAWLIMQGAVPYRDILDMNLPGVYLLHLGLLNTLGPSDAAWRFFDLAWLLATTALLFAYCRPLGGALGGAAAALVFALYHLGGGAAQAGQRDYLMCVFLLAGLYGMAHAWEGRPWRRSLLLAGLALGAAMTIKPFVGVLWLGCAVLAAIAARRRGWPVWQAAGAVLAGGGLPPALCGLWLLSLGALPAFISVQLDFNLPFYGKVNQVSIPRMYTIIFDEFTQAIRFVTVVLVNEPPSLRAIIGGLLGLPVLGLVIRILVVLGAGLFGLAATAGLAVNAGLVAVQRFTIRHLLAGVGLLYGVLNYVAQGRGSEYHRYPMVLFVCVLLAAALSLAVAYPPRWPRRFAGAFRFAPPVALAAVLALVGARDLALPERNRQVAVKEQRVTEVAAELRRLVPPGGTAQVMDMVSGGIHSLLRAGIQEPTRFIYDFQFYEFIEDPRIQALQSEYLAALRQNKPAAVVVFKESWARHDYDRLDRFPAMLDVLQQDYTLAVAKDDYRIYVPHG